PHGIQLFALPTHCPRRYRRNGSSRVVLSVAATASSNRKSPSAGLPIFQPSRSSIAYDSGVAYSTSANDLSSGLLRPYSTSRHMTESTLSAGVEIARVSDSARLPAASAIASHTGSVTT